MNQEETSPWIIVMVKCLERVVSLLNTETVPTVATAETVEKLVSVAMEISAFGGRGGF